MGTEDMTHGYWGYDSQVLQSLTGTEDMAHEYWWYDLRVMHILMGTAYSLYSFVQISRNLGVFWKLKMCYILENKPSTVEKF